jgi:hypothetical protein
MQLNWRVENRGTGNTPLNQAPWVDGIYLSKDQTFSPQTDRFIGSREHSGGFSTERQLHGQQYSALTFHNDIAETVRLRSR